MMNAHQDRTSYFRQRVDSTSLASVGYDPTYWTLDIEFRKGSVYRYFWVLPSVYQSLMQAPSKGRFFMTQIRDRFPYTPVSS